VPILPPWIEGKRGDRTGSQAAESHCRWCEEDFSTPIWPSISAVTGSMSDEGDLVAGQSDFFLRPTTQAAIAA
jgi:hypothetical protein